MVGRDGLNPEIAPLHKLPFLVSGVTESEPVEAARGSEVGDGYVDMVEQSDRIIIDQPASRSLDLPETDMSWGLSPGHVRFGGHEPSVHPSSNAR